jgi:serine/threonine-protein kinase
MVGEALGNYRLVAQIGSGSMGVVFLAEHQRIERRVAIKVLGPELVSDQRALQRFFVEALATSRIRHPGIVEVFDCDVDATGRAYIVLEHLEGETLAERLRRAGKLHWSAAGLIARRLADALGAAHEKGIVHRDLKPENVFLVGNGRDPTAAVKVLDFGVAKLLASEAISRVTMRGTVVGTPEYMSPEQCAGAEVDHRADIYALGCILFEMLTGQPPFLTSTVRELALAHRFRPAPSAAASCPDLPDWLGDLLARMLAKEPERRPASMREVYKSLCQYKAQRWSYGTTAVRAAEPGKQPPSARARSTRTAAIARRRTALALVVGAMVVLAGAVWAMRRNQAVVSPPRLGAASYPVAP